jgi:hypothetical protein
MRMRIGTAFIFPALFALAGFGQMTSVSSHLGSDGQWTATATFGGNALSQYLPVAVVGVPYSGVQISQRIQTLADGTKLTQDNPSIRYYRDSAGRTRTERPFMAVPSTIVKNVPSMIEIADPVAGYRIVLDPVNKVAHRTVGQRSPQMILPRMAGSTPSKGVVTSGAVTGAGVHLQTSTERLGTKTIDGLSVEGVRMTITHPIGEMGNDRPVMTILETWTSPELMITVFSKNSDPRSGDSITALTNIDRAEPDPALFQIPRGYQVVEETGSFTITITVPRQ